MEANLSKTCRACLKKLALVSRKLSDPMRHENESVTYLDAFVSCTGFKVESTESQELCDECASELFISFNFKEKCTSTQKEMQKLLMSKIKQEEEEEDILQVKLEVFADSISIDKVKDTFFQDEDKKTAKEMPKNRKNLKCDLCGIYVIYLLQHYNLKHGKLKTVSCPHCNLKQYPQLLDTHVERCRTRRKNERKKRVVQKEDEMGLCPICGVIKSKLHINSHLLQRSKKENTFICDICGNKLKSKRRLVSHMQIQHLKIPFKCRYCSMEVRNSQLLDTHKRLIHPEIKSVLKCEYCEYTTVYHGSLRVHRAVHTGKKNHKCDICQRSFTQKTRLTDHRAIHFDERPFACDRCGATFKSKRYLGMHQRVHQEHDYECPVCKRTFSSNQLMTSHAKKNHPDYQLPPPGTVMSKSYRKRVAEKRLKHEALRNGIDLKVVEAIVVKEAPPLEELHMMQSY